MLYRPLLHLCESGIHEYNLAPSLLNIEFSCSKHYWYLIHTLLDARWKIHAPFYTQTDIHICISTLDTHTYFYSCISLMCVARTVPPSHLVQQLSDDSWSGVENTSVVRGMSGKPPCLLSSLSKASYNGVPGLPARHWRHMQFMVTIQQPALKLCCLLFSHEENQWLKKSRIQSI